MPMISKATSSKRKASTPVVTPPDMTDQGPVIRAYDLFQGDLPTSVTLPRSLPALDAIDSGGEDDAGHMFALTNEFRTWTRRQQQQQPNTPTQTCPPSSVALVYQAYKDDCLHYLPLRTIRSSNRSSDYIIPLACRQRFEPQLGGEESSGVMWPSDELPVELFDNITGFLTRDDMQSMRLVNREFEKKVSMSFFTTSVVPFNTELYDMIEDDTKITELPIPQVCTKPSKGKGRAISSSLNWKNASEDPEGKVYKGHGLKVFQGFGPHIRRFGMSFEVSEQHLSNPPVKKELDDITSYHGYYNWPHPYYRRFDALTGLETAADETSRMKEAFEKLAVVKELGLSIDSGLGWLTGPDQSAHTKMFGRPSPVFGNGVDASKHTLKATSDFWSALQGDVAEAPQMQHESTLTYRSLDMSPNSLAGLKDTIYANNSFWLKAPTSQVIPDLHRQSGCFGVVYCYTAQLDSLLQAGNMSAVKPAELCKGQKEWLLETEWAQRAFLECYMLAITGTPSNFLRITTLNIAKLSSGFIQTIAAEHFWQALPALKDLTLLISPEWRSANKDAAGFAELTLKNPSDAVSSFYGLLHDRIWGIATIKKLRIGYTSECGEHAPGMFARNTNVLPAPVVRLDFATAANPPVDAILTFPYVEELVLENCWLTPVVLEGLVTEHAQQELKQLSLISVSLTAHPHFPAAANVQQGQAMAIAQQNQQIAQAQQMFAMGLGPVQPPPMPQAVVHILNHGNPTPQQVAYVQQWQNNMQQLQQQQMQAAQLHQMGQQWNLQGGILGAINHHQAQPTRHWSEPHRDGSWAHLLDLIGPGAKLASFGPDPHRRGVRGSALIGDEDAVPITTNLRKILLQSCGYVRLPSPSFDQSTIEHGTHMLSPWFRTRQAILKSFMLEARDRNLGTIAQFMPARELEALRFAWGVTEGWIGVEGLEGREVESEYDGLATGGTGRVSGIVRASD
ncbi:hypothetical protein LTR86_000944 [Recurvomyces mirabilis]|nr:hypothetical protein LTR86_000944 [Recurvomyces mirabilis]